MRNQIDHFVNDGQHASSVLDVRTFGGVFMDSERYLAAAKIHMHISNASNLRRKGEYRQVVAQSPAEVYFAQLGCT